MNADMPYLKQMKPTQEELHQYLSQLRIEYKATTIVKSTHWLVPDVGTYISAHFDPNFGKFEWAQEVKPEQLIEKYYSPEYTALFRASVKEIA